MEVRLMNSRQGFSEVVQVILVLPASEVTDRSVVAFNGILNKARIRPGHSMKMARLPALALLILESALPPQLVGIFRAWPNSEQISGIRELV
jgi:hypothetical protein